MLFTRLDTTRTTSGSHLNRPTHSRHVRLFQRTEIPGLVDGLAGAMNALRYSRKEIFAVRLALEEALVNAIEHGKNHARANAERPVRLRYVLTPSWVLLKVKDPGDGFDTKSVLDPRDPDNLDKPHGRGLLLIAAFMTWIRFNPRGNCLTMCKRRVRQTDAPPRLLLPAEFANDYPGDISEVAFSGDRA